MFSTRFKILFSMWLCCLSSLGLSGNPNQFEFAAHIREVFRISEDEVCIFTILNESDSLAVFSESKGDYVRHFKLAANNALEVAYHQSTQNVYILYSDKRVTVVNLSENMWVEKPFIDSVTDQRNLFNTHLLATDNFLLFSASGDGLVFYSYEGEYLAKYQDSDDIHPKEVGYSIWSSNHNSLYMRNYWDDFIRVPINNKGEVGDIETYRFEPDLGRIATYDAERDEVFLVTGQLIKLSNFSIVREFPLELHENSIYPKERFMAGTYIGDAFFAMKAEPNTGKPPKLQKWAADDSLVAEYSYTGSYYSYYMTLFPNTNGLLVLNNRSLNPRIQLKQFDTDLV